MSIQPVNLSRKSNQPDPNMNLPIPSRTLLAPLCSAILPALFATSVNAQVPITGTTPITENFDSMGTSTTATLPSSWKMTAAAAGTTAGYATAANVTAVTQGASSGSPTAGGRYNWGSSATDRAAGFMTSGSYGSPNAIMVAYVNNTGSTITSISISFIYERYRVNSAAASVAFFSSTDGSTWTAQTDGDSGAFATGTSSYTFSGGTTVSKTVTLIGLSIAAGSQIYFKWNFNTTGSSSQGLGLDDVSLTATTSGGGGTPPVITAFDPASGAAGTAVTIGGSNFTGATNVAFNGVAATFSNVTETSLSATVPAGALSGPISVSTPAGLATSTNSFLVPTITVVLPATINEGASGFGEAQVNVEPANDIEVTLTSSSTNDLVLETPITISAGTTNYTFSITAPSDSVIDGNTNVTVMPSAVGYAAAPGTISVVNVDAVKIPLTTFASNSYTQNFDSLGTTTISNVISLTTGVQTGLGSAVSTNLNGWYAAKISGSGGIANIVANNGSGNSGAVYNYGDTNEPANTDRSLGGLASGSFTPGFGALIKNETGQTLQGVQISFISKLWRSSTVSNALTFGYGLVDGSAFTTANFLTAAGATPLVSADVVYLPAATGGPVDGNLPANQIAFNNVTIPQEIAPGETLFIRWQDFDGANSDAGIAIDNISLTALADAPPATAPFVAPTSAPANEITRTQAGVTSSVTGDGGSAITARGFVYAVASVNPNPTIGGTGSTDLPSETAEVGPMAQTITGLTAGTTYAVRSYAANEVGTTYSSAATFTTLSPPLSFTGNYSESFSTYSGTLPAGWTVTSSSNNVSYQGAWGTGSTGGFRGVGETTGPVLGYQHTSSTGILAVSVTFVNDTQSSIETLDVSYLGRTALPANTRTPAWAVSVNGVAREALAYSTGNTEGEEGAPADLTVSALLDTDLGIAPGAEFTVTWVSERGGGGGSSRQIGLADFVITTGAPATPSVDVTGAEFNPFSTTLGTPSSPQTVSVSGANLTDDLTVTAPAGFEVSSDGSTYAPSVDLPPTSGSVAATTMSVRLTGAAVGEFTGNVSFASAGATPENRAVSGTVSSGGQTFEGWAQGAPLDQANLLKYAIGGASSPTATDGVAPVTGITATDLTLSAIVRTNDPSLTTVGNALIDLVSGAWSSNGVTMTVDGNQDEVPEGCERQTFSTPRGVDGKKFLRLESTLSGQ